MTGEQYIPTNTEFLVNLLTGDAQQSYVGATVQRSHRFPAHLFFQIENMARIGDVPVSLIINQIIECGLDAVMSQLPEDVANQIRQISPEQLERPMVTDRIEAKSKVAKARSKSKLTPTK